MILYAINISSGGGKVLLDEVLLKQPLGEVKALFLDERYQLPQGYNTNGVTIFRIRPKLFTRWKSEFKLRQISKILPNEQVICFGNLPPAFRLASRTILYLQNAFLLSNTAAPRDSLKLLLRNLYEKMWFKIFINNADEIWVQTKWMKNSLPANLSQITSLKPIFPTLPKVDQQLEKTIDFIAITGTIKYKNLIPLLEGIRDAKITNKNFVIVSDGSNQKIDMLLKEIKEKHIKLDYLTSLSREKVFDLLSKSKCLLLTSELESFCLPLHEAIHFKMHIIAGKYDFVTEYINPTIALKKITAQEVSKALLLYSSP